MNPADQIEQVMHRDRCTVLRAETVQEDDGVERSTDTVIYEGVACKVSRKTLPVAVQTDTVAVVSYALTVFFHPRYAITEGDILECTLFNGSKMTLKAGAVMPYTTATQVAASEEVQGGWARAVSKT